MKKTGFTIRNKTINYNIKSQLYEITEAGTTYAMELDMLVQLKKTMGHEPKDNFETWYNSLSKSDKGKIIRTGFNSPQLNDQFYPDLEFD